MHDEFVLAIQPLLQAPRALPEDAPGPIPADPMAAVTALLVIERGVAVRYLGRESVAAWSAGDEEVFDMVHYDQVFPDVWPVEYLRQMVDLGRVFRGIDYLPG